MVGEYGDESQIARNQELVYQVHVERAATHILQCAAQRLVLGQAIAVKPEE